VFEIAVLDEEGWKTKTLNEIRTGGDPIKKSSLGPIHTQYFCTQY